MQRKKTVFGCDVTILTPLSQICKFNEILHCCIQESPHSHLQLPQPVGFFYFIRLFQNMLNNLTHETPPLPCRGCLLRFNIQRGHIVSLTFHYFVFFLLINKWTILNKNQIHRKKNDQPYAMETCFWFTLFFPGRKCHVFNQNCTRKVKLCITRGTSLGTELADKGL